jgi:hypothetical protein
LAYKEIRPLLSQHFEKGFRVLFSAPDRVSGMILSGIEDHEESNRKRSALFLAIVFTAFTGSAERPQAGQGEIVATSENNSYTANGNPLQFTTDWTSRDDSQTIIPPLLTATYIHSARSASRRPLAFTVRYSKGGKSATIFATLDSREIIPFVPMKASAAQSSGTLRSSGGGCSQVDGGTFTATLYQPLGDSFTGSMESYAGDNAAHVTITIDTSSSFAVPGGVQSTNKNCMSNLRMNGMAAQAYGQSLAHSDTEDFLASDNSGNGFGFVASATDPNGNALNPAWPSQFYATHQVLAGPCAGDTDTDSSFQKVQTQAFHPHLPVRIFHLWPRAASAPPAEVLPSMEADAQG